MNIDLEKLSSLVNEALKIACPKLSGNMRNHIQIESVGDREITISIKAPFYDLNEFRKTNTIRFTGANYGGITDYAMWVNKKGAFGGRSTRSKNWVYNTLDDIVGTYANEIGAEFNDLIKK